MEDADKSTSGRNHDARGSEAGEMMYKEDGSSGEAEDGK